MATETESPQRWQPPRIALVLQGGGALGAYQGGVFQALEEQGLDPDWVVGTSIGAINAAIIAGNARGERLEKLKEFWEIVSQEDVWDPTRVEDDVRQLNTFLTALGVLSSGISGFFARRRPAPPFMGDSADAATASFYETDPLRETLNRLVDFKRLAQEGATRLTMGAVNVTSGKLVYFDSKNEALKAEHVMASGALPPGFPAVRIDGEPYWDGGVCSNTPIDALIDDDPPVDTLCIMVDLWNPVGPEPRSIAEVQTRQKDILYATRSRHTLKDYRRMQDIRRAFCALSEKLPPELQELREMETLTRLLGGPRLTIIRLTYPGQDWGMPSKDINFSRGSIKWRWDQGYRDALRAVEQEGWLNLPPTTGALIYELPPEKPPAPEEPPSPGKGKSASTTRAPRKPRKPRT